MGERGGRYFFLTTIKNKETKIDFKVMSSSCCYIIGLLVNLPCAPSGTKCQSILKKKSYQLLKTMVGVNEVSCKNHLLSGSCCGLKVYRCTAPNATGFPLLSLILGFHILNTRRQSPIEFYSAPASLSDLIPKGDLVLTEWFFLFQQHSLWKWIEKGSFIIPYLAWHTC